MALRFQYLILFFSFVLLMGCSNGARDVVEKDRKLHDQASYITGYNTMKGEEAEDAKDTSQSSYITGYKNAKETSQPYITGYRNVQAMSQPYITGYRNVKDSSQTYVTSYGDVKETSQPYITSYGDAKETSQPYTTSYKNLKETIQSYVTSYGDAENTNKRPHVTAHGNGKETKKGPYVTGYGAAYGTSQDPKSKCNDHDHSSSHNGGHEHKGHEHHMHTQSSTGLDQNEAFKVGFFIPKNLYTEKTMPLYFPIKDHSSFLPKEVADSIPFSLSQLPNILQLFSIPQGSPEAKEMEQTLQECRAEPIDSEIKLCATSLESMVAFVNRILGSDQNQFNLLSTTHPTITTALTQNYTVLEAPKEVSAPKMVFCHPEPYPYAVFFCHYFGTETKVFRVSLSGESGDKVDAIAICHMDTSDWDPSHVLFQMLGVTPGASSPVCHFLPANHLVWLPSPTKATA